MEICSLAIRRTVNLLQHHCHTHYRHNHIKTHVKYFLTRSQQRLGNSGAFDERVLSVKNSFKNLEINRIFILEKITKYDLEIKNGLTPIEISNRFPLAYNTHMTHKCIMESLIRQLRDNYRIHFNVVKAQTPGLLPLNSDKLQFLPDMVISAGGDGTFLEAASLIPPEQLTDRPIWLVGLNTDPERSLGALCVSYFDRNEFLINNDMLKSYKCDYKRRLKRKIRFKYSDTENPLDAGDTEIAALSQASFNSHVFNVGEDEDQDDEEADVSATSSPGDFDVYSMTYDEYVRKILDKLLLYRTVEPICRQRIRLKLFKRDWDFDSALRSKCVDSTSIENILFSKSEISFTDDELRCNYKSIHDFIPHAITNDVMIADRFFGKTFYALIQIDDSPIIRVKSSGVLITTGTGSTAWAYNICKMDITSASNLVKSLLNHPSVPDHVGENIDDGVISDSVECYNERLKMDPSSNHIRCIIREGITEKFTEQTYLYTGKQVKVLVLAKDAMLCIDGSKTLSLDYGDIAVLKTFETDIIWSCI